jgi:hypothetical protein
MIFRQVLLTSYEDLSLESQIMYSLAYHTTGPLNFSIAPNERKHGMPKWRPNGNSITPTSKNCLGNIIKF